MKDKCHGGQMFWRTDIMEDKCYEGQIILRTNVMEDKCYGGQILWRTNVMEEKWCIGQILKVVKEFNPRELIQYKSQFHLNFKMFPAIKQIKQRCFALD